LATEEPVGGGASPAGQLAASFFLTIAVLAFPSAMLVFNRQDDAPNQDDSLVAAPVLIHLRVMLGVHLAFWAFKMASLIIVSVNSNTFGGVA
jgi:hypothetical protein